MSCVTRSRKNNRDDMPPQSGPSSMPSCMSLSNASRAAAQQVEGHTRARLRNGLHCREPTFPGFAQGRQACIAVAVAMILREFAVDHRGDQYLRTSWRPLRHDAVADRAQGQPFLTVQELWRIDD